MKKVITILSDSPTIPTGYRDQSVMVADYLVSKGYEVHFLGNAYTGSTIDKIKFIGEEVHNFKLYGMGLQPYFADVITNHLKETKSDYFLILLDTFMLMDGQGKLAHMFFFIILIHLLFHIISS